MRSSFFPNAYQCLFLALFVLVNRASSQAVVVGTPAITPEYPGITLYTPFSRGMTYSINYPMSPAVMATNILLFFDYGGSANTSRGFTDSSSVTSILFSSTIYNMFFNLATNQLYPLPLNITMKSTTYTLTGSTSVSPAFSSPFYEKRNNVTITSSKAQSVPNIGIGQVCSNILMVNFTNPNYYQSYLLKSSVALSSIVYSTNADLTIMLVTITGTSGTTLSFQAYDVSPYSSTAISGVVACNTPSLGTPVVNLVSVPYTSKKYLFLSASNTISAITIAGQPFVQANIASFQYSGQSITIVPFQYSTSSQLVFVAGDYTSPSISYTPPVVAGIIPNITAILPNIKYFTQTGASSSVFKGLSPSGKLPVVIGLQFSSSDNLVYESFSIFNYNVAVSPVQKIIPGLIISSYLVFINNTAVTTLNLVLTKYNGVTENYTISYDPITSVDFSPATPQFTMSQTNDKLILTSVSQMTDSYQQPAYSYSYNVQTPSTYISLPTRTIPLEFPYLCKGYSSNMTWTPVIPVLPDTPVGATFQLMNTATQIPILQLPTIENKIVDDLDLLAPFATLSITYANKVSGQTYDLLKVAVNDYLGVDYRACSVQYGPLTFNLSHSSKAAGGDSGQQLFVFPFKTNPYFCNENIKFSCQDLRGNAVQWTRDDLGSLSSTFLSQGSGCVSSALATSFKIISIDATYAYATTNPGHYFTLTAFIDPALSASNFNFQLYLDPVDKTDMPYLISLSSQGSNTFSSQVTPIQTQINVTNSFKYSLQLTHPSYPGVTVTHSYDELLYISQLPPATFTPSVLIYHPSSLGFSTYSFEFTNIGTYSMVFGQNTQVKNFTYCISNETYFYPACTTIVLGFSINFTIPKPSSNHRIWVDTICDLYSTCNQFPASAYTFAQNLSASATSVDMDAGVNFSTSFSTNILNINSPIRTLTVSFSLNLSGVTTWVLEKSHLPIFYLVEDQSMYRISSPMTLSSVQGSVYNYTTTFELPLYWGSRGLYSMSVYNIYNTLGQFHGYTMPITNLSLNFDTQPDIWNSDFSTGTLIITGSSLGAIGSSGSELVLKSNGAQVTLEYEFINSTAIYVKNLNSAQIANAQVLVGTKVITVTSCMNPTCSGNGQCVQGTCECNSGFGGLDCSVSLTYTCTDNCSGNGQCVNMICNCDSTHMGPTCATQITSNTIAVNLTTNSVMPTSTMNSFTSTVAESSSSNLLSSESSKTTFNVLLTSIQELDYINQQVKFYNLIGTWDMDSPNDTTYIYTTELTSGSLLTVVVYITTDQAESFSFANTTLLVPKNSVKYYIKLENYTFSSSLNHLSFNWEANYEAPNQCETETQDITYGGSSLDDVHYIVLPANQLQLYGRFSNQIILDEHIIMVSNQAILSGSKILINVSTPFFSNQLELDPDFSVLVNYNQQTSQTAVDKCNPTSSKKGLPRYALIVLCVVVPIVGILILVGVLNVLYRRNLKFKMFVLASKSKLSVGRRSTHSSKLSRTNVSKSQNADTMM